MISANGMFQKPHSPQPERLIPKSCPGSIWKLSGGVLVTAHRKIRKTACEQAISNCKFYSLESRRSARSFVMNPS
jgi:hypothetical protein